MLCVCCYPNYSGRQACGRTGRGHTGFLIHLPSAVLASIFLARRIHQPFLSLVDREVEFLCTYVRLFIEKCIYLMDRAGILLSWIISATK